MKKRSKIGIGTIFCLSIFLFGCEESGVGISPEPVDLQKPQAESTAPLPKSLEASVIVQPVEEVKPVPAPDVNKQQETSSLEGKKDEPSGSAGFGTFPIEFE